MCLQKQWTFIFKGLHPSGCSVPCSRLAAGSWVPTWREAVITGVLPGVSLLVLPSDGWQVLPADLQVYPPIGGRAGGWLIHWSQPLWNKQPFKATALCQAPQLADIWPSCFGHWPSSVNLDTHMAISQLEGLAVLNLRACLHFVNIQYGNSMVIDRGVDGNRFPLAFCLMNSMPSFCGRQAQAPP